MGGLFFQKERPKKLFMGDNLEQNLWRGYMDGGTNDRITGGAKYIFQ